MTSANANAEAGDLGARQDVGEEKRLANSHVRAAMQADIKIGGIIVSDRMRKLRPEKIDELAESIGALGLLHPIIVRPWGDDAFLLVAGWHRLAAIHKLGHDTIRAEVREGLAADQAELIEIDENLIRADLTDAERAIHLARRKELYEKAHPEAAHGAIGRGRKKSSQNENSFVADTATKTGKGRSTVARDITRANKIVNLGDLVGTSLDQGEELDALAKLPEDVQRDLIERAKAGEEVTAKHVVHRLRREERERDLAEATKAASETLGQELYGVILVDFPWPFDAYSSESGLERSPEAHYPTMSLDEIKAFKLPAAPDCIVFSWTTTAHSDDAIDVMRGHGFEFRTEIIWYKEESEKCENCGRHIVQEDPPKEGTGYWFRNLHEKLLIGVRGKVPAPVMGTQFPSVIKAPRGRHSEKPEIFYQIIERYFPTTPKIELFARKARPGWRVWGNEVETLREAAE
jgi:N6-adenosine-specific RNA methylase IME4/ParB-like chromosome segregation protein Spo0J